MNKFLSWLIKNGEPIVDDVRNFSKNGGQSIPIQSPTIDIETLDPRLNRFRGVVEKFFSARGFGFLKTPLGCVFLHVSRVSDGASLKEGDVVAFTAKVTQKGLLAIQVQCVNGGDKFE